MPRKSSLTGHRKTNFYDLVDKGVPVAEIAKMVGLSIATAYRIKARRERDKTVREKPIPKRQTVLRHPKKLKAPKGKVEIYPQPRKISETDLGGSLVALTNLRVKTVGRYRNGKPILIHTGDPVPVVLTFKDARSISAVIDGETSRWYMTEYAYNTLQKHWKKTGQNPYGLDFKNNDDFSDLIEEF